MLHYNFGPVLNEQFSSTNDEKNLNYWLATYVVIHVCGIYLYSSSGYSKEWPISIIIDFWFTSY